MPHEFDEQYWERHWKEAPERPGGDGAPVNPYLARLAEDLAPGTVLDAGSGAGTETRWLAARGWDVTAVDISAEAQRRAAEREALDPPSNPVAWVVADLEVWEPAGWFDLVCTHYAHPAGSQLDFYSRISEWVAVGGRLLIVGHLHGDDHGKGSGGFSDEDGPPAEASLRATDVAALFEDGGWVIERADEVTRSLFSGAGRSVELHDVVVVAVRDGGRK